MAAPLPYTHYACPCSDLISEPVAPASTRTSTVSVGVQLDKDRSFNPHDPRANFSLYPLEHLLYCDECESIACPRCWTEETLYWYCPSCLFEVPSSAVRADGNRCSRSCYNCPACTSPLAIVTLPQTDDGEGQGESYILQCQFCEWNTLDIDVRFDKPTKITEQLARQHKARLPLSSDKEPAGGQAAGQQLDHDSRFADLANFYRGQLNESDDPQKPFSGSPYSSPANLARIMSLYGGLSYSALKKTREKPQPMREALSQGEGLATYGSESTSDDDRTINLLEARGWDGASSHDQQLSAPVNTDARFVDQLWPTATPLRTKRGKRCKTCRQFLARPEPKVSSMRYRIRLLAMHYLPRLSLRPLHAAQPMTNPAFDLRNGTTQQPSLTPLEPRQYVLTIRNPIFDNINVTLATPAVTPGRVSSRVTILCPTFTVGPAGDVWDEALSAATPAAAGGGRTAAMAALTGSAAEVDRQPEAGKVWERTRNSTSVVVEIVPASLPAAANKADGDSVDNDDNVLEVPVYVRVEWEAEVKEGESSMGKKGADRRPGEKVRKELGYWIVLGVGTIAA